MTDSSSEDSAIELVLQGHEKDLGEVVVRRVLPALARRHVGPFIFFDHIGPTVFAAGRGMNVRPHPHIGLATITYLFSGEFTHRDSLGSEQVIHPGDVNWMVSGRGIVHSERTGDVARAAGGPLHGVQTWVALPMDLEEMEPRFEHHPERTLPRVDQPGVALRVIAGTAYGVQSPTGVLSPTLYVHAAFDADGELVVDEGHEERAVHVASGSIECEGRRFEAGSLLVLRPGRHATLRSSTESHVLLIGGAPLDGPRHVWWNFASSVKPRIERAKEDWRAGGFAKVPGDEVEFIPLPAEPLGR